MESKDQVSESTAHSDIGFENFFSKGKIKQDKLHLKSYQEPSLVDINGMAIKLLLNIVNYSDHSVCLTTLQSNLDMNRSSFYYTIKKLQKLNLIEINMPISEDQRKKTITLSSEGKNFLQSFYMNLKSHIESKM